MGKAEGRLKVRFRLHDSAQLSHEGVEPSSATGLYGLKLGGIEGEDSAKQKGA